MFITIEGSNGVGKTTIIAALAKRLIVLGFDVFLIENEQDSVNEVVDSLVGKVQKLHQKRKGDKL